MKKDIARREFIKLKLNGYSYAACQKELFQRHNFTAGISTLKRWWKRFNQGDWNLRDIPQRQHTIHYKYAVEDLEEAIAMHGKPREILTDNGSEFGGKVSRLQYTIVYELPYCRNDLEYFRWRYNCDRPHRSLNGLTPNQVYFGWKRRKKYILQ